jgi:Polyketide cyclase / dehydrase and lipid transport
MLNWLKRIGRVGLSKDVAVAVQRQLTCTAEDVFAVLADGWLYPLWVVGASRMRAVDPDWPAVGAKLHHSAGVWPLLVNDDTEMLSNEPPRSMILNARGWPAGEARVEITIDSGPTGCVVRIEEDATSGPAALIPKQVRQSAIGLRNRESLRRLAYLAEGRAARRSSEAP